MSAESWDDIIGRFLDGAATDEEAAALSSAIETDPVVRSRYLDFAELHAALSADESLRDFASEAQPNPVPAVVVKSFPLQKTWWAVAAGLVLLLGGTLWWFASRAALDPKLDAFMVDGPTSTRAEMPDTIAILKRTSGVVWENETFAPAKGKMLAAGWLRFSQGTMQIEFLSGVQLLVSGPAAVRLDSEQAAFLEKGVASVFVPDSAKGFRLLAPGLDVEDLGTAFGLEVKKDAPSEVHVFDGMVRVRAGESSGKSVELRAGKAAQIVKTELHEVPVRAADFPNGEALSHRVAEDAKQRIAAWKQVTTRMAQDPASLVLMNFERGNGWMRTVPNEGRAATLESAGTLVGTGWTSGRWQGKRGLEFRSLGDRMRFQVAGEHAAISLLAWVRVDSLPNDYNSLLMPSHYQTGSIHWTLERGGEMRLSMLKNASVPLTAHGWDGPVSAPAISSMDFGRWIFLATTYDSASGMVTHYCDGRKVGAGMFAEQLPAVLGDLEFGNWGADSSAEDNRWVRLQPKFQRTRNFVGRMDDLAVFSRALTSDEIAEIHTAGQP